MSTTSALRVIEDPDKTGNLYFYKREEWKGEIPLEQTYFQIELDKTCSILRSRFVKEEQKFIILFNDLVYIASGVFNEDITQIDLGKQNLENFKNAVIANEADSINNEYLRSLAISGFSYFWSGINSCGFSYFLWD